MKKDRLEVKYEDWERKMLTGQVYNPGQDKELMAELAALQGQVPPLQPIEDCCWKEGAF